MKNRKRDLLIFVALSFLILSSVYWYPLLAEPLSKEELIKRENEFLKEQNAFSYREEQFLRAGHNQFCFMVCYEFHPNNSRICLKPSETECINPINEVNHD